MFARGAQDVRRGVRNVLAHFGVLDPAIASPPARPDACIPGHDGYVLATSAGDLEPFHPLGARVEAGQEAGRIHNLIDPSRTPEIVRYRRWWLRLWPSPARARSDGQLLHHARGAL